MPRELPADYVPTNAELAAGRVWQAASELNRIAREAATAHGLTINFTLGRAQETSRTPSQVFVDTQTAEKVVPVWYVDANGDPLPLHAVPAWPKETPKRKPDPTERP